MAKMATVIPEASAPVKRVCVVCGGEYEAARKDKKHCSTKCKNRKGYLTSREKHEKGVAVRRVCPVCKVEFEVDCWHPKQTFCSSICSKKNHYQNNKALASERGRRRYKENIQHMKAQLAAYRATRGPEATQYREAYKTTLRAKYLSYKGGALRRGLGFLISEEAFSAFWQQPCVYCGAEILTVGLDRVDSDRGYIEGNIVPCCTACNYSKRTYTAKEYIERCHRVATMNPLGQIEESI